MTEETLGFQAEVSKLLNIVANALYSEKEIFLRELISNSSDACDRLRYEAITDTKLTADDPQFSITVSVDKKTKTLTIADNGIGMNRDELVANLGTIARSGTMAFLEQLSGETQNDVSLIGQFGVGFYSSFIVSNIVEVISRKAGDTQTWKWQSDGKGEFTIAPSKREGRGTTVILNLKKGEEEFLDPKRLESIIKTYSDHVSHPISLAGRGIDREEAVNTASALWMRPKKDITEEQYREFYHHVGHTFDDPWLIIHSRAEGKIEYTLLLFVPSAPPFDLFDPVRKSQVKLYVKRVFITDDCEGLIPPYLRFARGVVDSEDLSLNVSREMMQNSPLVRTISKALVKRILRELLKKADKAPDEYAEFWKNFGAVLKEGIYEDGDQRESLLKLVRFRSTQSGEKLISLADYVSGMKENQSEIYTISGDNPTALTKSPQLEGFIARGIEVILLTDPIDEFWVPLVNEYDSKPFKSVTRGGANLEDIETEDRSSTEDTESEDRVGTLIALLKLNLGDRVKDVRRSERLTESAVCLVADEGDIDMHLKRLLEQSRREAQSGPRILEINSHHSLIVALAEAASKEGAADMLADAAELLFEQAMIIEGEPVPDPAAFSRRLNETIVKALTVS